MIFNSLWYILFLLITVFACYRIEGKRKLWLLLIANLFFYSTNSLLSLISIIIIILLSYSFGIYIGEHAKRRRFTAITFAVVILLLPLCLFKYMNFLLGTVGIHEIKSFSILPIGISFYTFQTIGYVFDVYRKKVLPEKNLLVYSLYASMFCYYGGPIGRSDQLLPQIRDFKHFGITTPENLSIGYRQLLFGCFLKVFCAESIALGVNSVYSDLGSASALNVLVATILFGFQLYCDFGGYSLMAQGSASCLNLRVITNFNEPYCSVSISDFWRRWHISLSTWFRDYVYIPLGGSRCSKILKYRNLMITFLLSGLWHGANWTYVIWGGVNGLYLCIESAFNSSSVKKIGMKALIGRVYTSISIFLAWGIFRSSSISDAFYVLKMMIFDIWLDFYALISGQKDILYYCQLTPTNLYNNFFVYLSLFIVISYDIYQYKRDAKLERQMSTWSPLKRNGVYVLTLFLLMVFGKWVSAGNFIYLQF